MTFEDEVTAIIRKAQEEKEQEIRQERDFEQGWEHLKRTIVFEALQEAAKAFAKTGVGSNAPSLRNGSVALEAGYRRTSFAHELIFSADKSRRVVVLKSPFDPEETFTLDALTPGVVEAAVKRFAFAVAREREDARPTGGGLVTPYHLG